MQSNVVAFLAIATFIAKYAKSIRYNKGAALKRLDVSEYKRVSMNNKDLEIRPANKPDLETREFDNYEAEARELYDFALEARDFFNEDFELEARDK
ncbi:hypothetical protein BDQ12DRAFT_723756 [Crucibulum laeve]|uniref:Uncharacterized protein n=1 Tax=Crucibulum laeve TaxID=68775 RepID=A0A5C3LXN4_9AGAR|nr:hypothetical protein BDQ12DRAFT_723756 [Crucibulum laeve]